MNLFKWLSKWWNRHQCEHSEHFPDCIIPGCPKAAKRRPLPLAGEFPAPPYPPKRGMGRYYSESTWTEILVNGEPQLMVDGKLTIKGSKDVQQVDMGHHGSICIQGGGDVTISINNTYRNNARIEGDGEVFLLSQKRGL
ncbi:hypothetical protein D9M71_379410 [compost metagenome]